MEASLEAGAVPRYGAQGYLDATGDNTIDQSEQKRPT